MWKGTRGLKPSDAARLSCGWGCSGAQIYAGEEEMAGVCCYGCSLVGRARAAVGLHCGAQC